MTLILGYIAQDFIVVASDGAEFYNTSGQPTYIGRKDTTKLFPLPDRPIVFAVHGTNQIVPKDTSFDLKKPIGEILIEERKKFEAEATVYGIATKIAELLKEDVEYTFRLHRDIGHHYDTRVAITIFGVDAPGFQPKCYEVSWSNVDPNYQLITNHLNYQVIGTLLHLATGGETVHKLANDSMDNFHPNRISGASFNDTIRYIRDLYNAAEQKQPSNKIDFGGCYQEIIIHSKGWYWTTPTSLKTVVSHL